MADMESKNTDRATDSLDERRRNSISIKLVETGGESLFYDWTILSSTTPSAHVGSVHTVLNAYLLIIYKTVMGYFALVRSLLIDVSLL